MPYFEPGAQLVLPGTYTVDTLPTAGAGNYGLLAKVTDLFGLKQAYVICQLYNGSYFWEPTGSSPAVTMSGNQDITFSPLKMPSVLTLDGTLTGNRTITMQTANAYPGMRFAAKFVGGLGIFGISLSGLNTGLLSLLLNTEVEAVYDASGVWKRLN